MTHTPGPWKITDNRSMAGSYWIEACHPEGFPVSIAEVRNGCEEAAELGTEEANAALIAAAPDLLSACKTALVQLRERKSFVDMPDRPGDVEYVRVRLRAAIAKAEAAP